MSELGTVLSKERSHNTHQGAQLHSKKAYQLSLQHPIVELRAKLEELSGADLTAAQRTKEIENILQVLFCFLYQHGRLVKTLYLHMIITP